MGMTTANDSAILMVSGTIVANTGDANYSNPVSIGSGAYVTADRAIAIGWKAYGKGIAIGPSAYVTTANQIAIGDSAYTTNDESVVIGNAAYSTSERSTAVGKGSTAGQEGVAYGYNTDSANYGVAIGSRATANGGICVGQNSESHGGSIMLGMDTRANSNEQGLGFGQGVHIRGMGGIAMGAFSEAYASGIAIGKYASAPASSFVVSIGDSVNERGMFSGAFNSTSSATDGYLNIFDNKLQVSGDGSVKVNNQYTFPTGVTTVNDYVLTAQTDGSTAWASGGGGAGTTYTAGTGLTLVGSEFNMYGTGALTELSITEALSTATPLTVKGAASQSADLTQWQNSAGTTLASMGMTTANDRAILMVSGAIIANTGDANYSNPVSIGSGAYVTQNDGIAIGRSAVGGGIAIGSTANASNTNGISIGKSSDCTASESVAVGFGAQATSNKTTVIGCNANVTNTHTVAIGYNVTAASYCVAIGANNTQATTTSAVAIGANTKANGNGAIAIGADAESNGDQTTTVGQGAGRNSSTSVYAIRIGKDANAGDSAIAIGWKTNVADSGFVVGNSSSNSILSGQFNSSTSHTDGFLNVLDNKLQVSGDGSVKVNNQYTFPTGVTTVNDYVLTAQTDGTTVWASGAGGGSTNAGTTYTAGTGLTLVGSEFNMYGTGALTELSITEALSTATPLTVKGAAKSTDCAIDSDTVAEQCWLRRWRAWE